jgi:hypothetical protein
MVAVRSSPLLSVLHFGITFFIRQPEQKRRCENEDNKTQAPNILAPEGAVYPLGAFILFAQNMLRPY